MLELDLCRMGVVTDLCKKILKDEGDNAHAALQDGEYNNAYVSMVHIETVEHTLDSLKTVLNMMLKAHSTIHAFAAASITMTLLQIISELTPMQTHIDMILHIGGYLA